MQPTPVLQNMPPECMSFCKTLYKSHVSGNYLFYLPMAFVKHMPGHDSDFVLVDESEREFHVKFRYKGYNFKGRGWKDFVIAHGLLEGDAVYFNLIAPCKFKVSIIRASRPIKAEPRDQNDEPLDSGWIAKLDRVVEMLPKPEFKHAYVRRKRRQTHDWIGSSNLNICDSPCDGDITRTAGNEQGVTDQSRKSGIENSKAALSFQDISFEEFKISINGQRLDLELPTPIQTKYYQLCRAQNKFLHENLRGGVDNKIVAGMIQEITGIADAMVAISISTPVHELDRMDSTLQSYEDKGMAVGHLRAEIGKLIKLSREHHTVEESSRAIVEELIREKNDFMVRKAKLDELLSIALDQGRRIGDLEKNIDAQTKKMSDLSIMFKAVTDRMRGNSAQGPS